MIRNLERLVDPPRGEERCFAVRWGYFQVVRGPSWPNRCIERAEAAEEAKNRNRADTQRFVLATFVAQQSVHCEQKVRNVTEKPVFLELIEQKRIRCAPETPAAHLKRPLRTR